MRVNPFPGGMRKSMPRRTVRSALRKAPILILLPILALLGVVIITPQAPARAAVSHALIQGDGSTWSENAVNQWIADVQQYGWQVVYTGVGSAQGRKDFANRTVDYAVSDIGYLGVDPVTGVSDTSQGRNFAYLPIVAGGTSFPYQIRVRGQLVTNLRLSGLTLAKIFTNQITNWDDPEITADNNGHTLPSLPIIPVVHSEGAGSTAQFTTYLATDFASIWQKFAGYSSFTEYFPRQGQQIAENGSDGVMNFLTSGAADGAIGYDEYSYPKAKLYPVAKIENSAGYFTAPTQYNVAVALTQAIINQDKSSPNYLLQNLSKVYVYGDKRTYPLSSYSYAIIPTSSTDQTMTTAKRQTLADWLSYSVCQGQREIGPIGYSPLPINLVEASFAQVAKLKQADSGVSLANDSVASCNNPTFIPGQPTRNYLAEIAPEPPACDQVGHGPCNGNQGLENGNPVGGRPTTGGTTGSAGGSGPGSSGTGSSGTGSSGTGSSGTGSSGTGTTASGASGSSGGGGSSSTGSGVSGLGSITGAQNGSSPGSVADVLGTPTLIGSGDSSIHGFVAALAAVLLLLILTLPPIVARTLGRRKERA